MSFNKTLRRTTSVVTRGGGMKRRLPSRYVFNVNADLAMSDLNTRSWVML